MAYDGAEVEVDLSSNSSRGKSSLYEVNIDRPAVGSAPLGAGFSAGSSSRYRSIPRGERCGRCFRRRYVRVTFRAVNILFALLFLGSAAVQYNDNDGVLWAAVYLAAAVYCVLSELSWRQLRTYFVVPTLWLFTACAFVGALYILIARLLVRTPKDGASGDEAMEFYGLSLVAFWMSIVLLLDRHNVVGVFRGYTSLSGEHERDKEGQVQMGEVVI